MEIYNSHDDQLGAILYLLPDHTASVATLTGLLEYCCRLLKADWEVTPESVLAALERLSDYVEKVPPEESGGTDLWRLTEAGWSAVYYD